MTFTVWDIGLPLCAQDTVDTLGEITINSVSLHIDGAWNCTNPQVMWTPNAVKGENRRKPRARGRKANPWRIDQGEYSLEMLIDGAWDVGANAPSATPWIGLQHNLEYLMTNVVNPPTAPTAVRAATIGMPDGDLRSGSVQPRTLIHEGTGTSVFTAVLTVYVPDGWIEPTGS